MSKVSAVSQQLSLVAEFQLKECAGIIIGIAALNDYWPTHTYIMCMLASFSGSPLEPPVSKVRVVLKVGMRK